MDFPITHLDIAVISKIKLQVFAKTLDMSGEM